MPLPPNIFQSLRFKLKFKLSAYLRTGIEKRITNHRDLAADNRNLSVRSRRISLSFEKLCYTGSRQSDWNLGLKEVEIFDFFVLELSQAEIVGSGVVVNANGEILLESTIFRTKYLHVLSQNHWLYFRQLFPALKLQKVIPLSSALQANYYHWIMEGIGRLVMMKLAGNLDGDEQLLIMKDPPRFMIDSIGFFFPEYRDRLVRSSSVRCKAECVKLASFPYTNNENTNFTDIYIPEVIKTINSFSREKQKGLVKKPVNIFISRKNSRDRKILNEEFFLGAIAPYNLKIVTLEDLSFEQQAELFFHADLIVTTHGAGLTNLLFANEPSMVIEFFPHNRDVRDVFCFGLISNFLKIRHEIIEYNSDSGDFQNFEVDTRMIEDVRRLLDSNATGK